MAPKWPASSSIDGPSDAEGAQVVADEPAVGQRGEVELEHDDAPAGDAAQLAQALRALGPVVVAEHRHRGVEGSVGERQRLGASPGSRGAASGRALGDHHLRRLDGDHLAVARLVRAGPGADVDHGARVAQRGVDRRPRGADPHDARGCSRRRSCRRARATAALSHRAVCTIRARMPTAAVLPIKTFSRAKHRLSDAVGDPHRPRWRRRWSATCWPRWRRRRAGPHRRRDRRAGRRRRRRAPPARTSSHDPAEAGQSAAATLGVEAARELGAERVLLVPGDCPALDPREVDALLERAGAAS